MNFWLDFCYMPPIDSNCLKYRMREVKVAQKSRTQAWKNKWKCETRSGSGEKNQEVPNDCNATSSFEWILVRAYNFHAHATELISFILYVLEATDTLRLRIVCIWRAFWSLITRTTCWSLTLIDGTASLQRRASRGRDSRGILRSISGSFICTVMRFL